MTMDPKESQTTEPSSADWLQSPAELQVPLTMPAGEVMQGEPDLKEPAVRLPISDTHAKFANEVHEYVREYIRNADQKAAFFFAATTTLLAFLHSRGAASCWLKAPNTWCFVDALAFLAMVALGVAAGVLLAVVFPRLKGSLRGIIFFNAIAEYKSPLEYAEDVVRLSTSDIVHTKLQHAYELAIVCRRKYLVLITGLYIASIGTGATLLFLVMG